MLSNFGRDEETSNRAPHARPPERLDGADLEREIAPTLIHMDADSKEEISGLAQTGHPDAAEKQLLDYVLTEDHPLEDRKEVRRKTVLDEGMMHSRIYWLAFVPVAILFYCIFCELFMGHIRFPWPSSHPVTTPKSSN